MSSPNTPENDRTPFAAMGLSDAVMTALTDVGYETPSPIQEATIGPLLAGQVGQGVDDVPPHGRPQQARTGVTGSGTPSRELLGDGHEGHSAR